MWASLMVPGLLQTENYARAILSSKPGTTAELSGGRRAVRDSKDHSGPALVFTPGEWAAFVGGVKNGEFG